MNEKIELFVINYLENKGGKCSEQELCKALNENFDLTDEEARYLLQYMLSEGCICHFNKAYYLPSPTPMPLPPNQSPSCN